MLLTVLLVIVQVIYLRCCEWLLPRAKDNKLRYNEKAHDPESVRIDGSCGCYPNCASDVWLRSCEREVLEPIEGRTTGTIPRWLNGSLLRNGPGSWKVGDTTFQHLFDCSAVLHRFAIKDGYVTYQNRFIETETLKKNRAAQRIVVTEFGTASVPDPCHSIFDRFSAIFRPECGSDNTMISIYPFGDEYYTFTEMPMIHRINPRTLATEGRLCVTDYVGVVNHTSHPHVLNNGTVFNVGLATTKSGPAYNVIRFPHGEQMFEDAQVVASLPCRWKLHPSYMHTFGITPSFFIIIEQPLSVSLPELVKLNLNQQPLAGCLKWFEDKPTLFHLIDRMTGRLRYTFQSEPFFYLHIINQYEDDEHVVVDICCYKDPGMINCMYLESIMNMQSNPNYAKLFRGRPLRFVLPLRPNSVLEAAKKNSETKRRMVKSFSMAGFSARLQQPKLQRSASEYDDITNLTTNAEEDFLPSKTKPAEKDPRYEDMLNLVTLSNTKAEAYQLGDGSILLRPELICKWGCETPRINYESYSGEKYRYFYAISSDVDVEHPGTLVKVDTENKTYKKWFEHNCYPSEPIFVAAPGAVSEDDGVVLSSIVWGGIRERHVGLLVLCAKSWCELGRTEFVTDGPVPKCLHGWFARDTV